jgi:signal transduction histidine kinase
MRWWLALAFAVIAAVTAVAIGSLYVDRSEEALRDRSRELSAGIAVSAAGEIQRGTRAGGELGEVVEAAAERRRISLWVVDDRGSSIASAGTGPLSELPFSRQAVAAVLAGERFLEGVPDGSATVVGLRLRIPGAEGLIVDAPTRELSAGLDSVRDALPVAVASALAIGALVGLVVAWLIGTRLRRIAGAAEAIEGGDFDRELSPRFHDELGRLASTVDRMRVRLRSSFEELESERDRLERTLEALHQGVVAVDDALVVEIANTAAKRLLRAAPPMPGAELADAWPDPSIREIAAELFREDAGVTTRRIAPEPDRLLEIVGVPPRGRSRTAVLLIADLSAAERRERAEREFVANAAHELRTPLTTLLGAVEMLQAGSKERPEERDRFIAHIDREARRLARLTRALLTLARAQTRAEAPRLVPVSIAPVLASVAADATPADGVRVTAECPEDLVVLTDSDLLEQILVNLVTNAVQHTRQGEIRLRGSQDADGVTIQVADTGPGIAAEHVVAIFDRFSRGGSRDRSGFGLGLAIVREATDAVGASVAIDTRQGGGTIVTVSMPGSRGEPA